MHLAVYPPTGRVRLAAPLTTDAEVVRLFAISKLGWIKKHIKNFARQPREATYHYVSGESHYFLGRRYLLAVMEGTYRPRVSVQGVKRLLMELPNGYTIQQRRTLLSEWYREQLKALLPALIAKWEPVVGAAATTYSIRQMRTKWGSCHPETGRILFNLELAKKPVACVEYVLVHELVHLLERKHSSRFITLLDSFLPSWRVLRDELRDLPTSHIKI